MEDFTKIFLKVIITLDKSYLSQFPMKMTPPCPYQMGLCIKKVQISQVNVGEFRLWRKRCKQKLAKPADASSQKDRVFTFSLQKLLLNLKEQC